LAHASRNAGVGFVLLLLLVPSFEWTLWPNKTIAAETQRLRGSTEKIQIRTPPITNHFDKSKLVKMLKERSHSKCHKCKISHFPQQNNNFLVKPIFGMPLEEKSSTSVMSERVLKFRMG
jgi:hypothetical protein